MEHFKRRFGIRWYRQHGEAGSVPTTAEDDMALIRTLCGHNEEGDIYNMDETGLFRRTSLDGGLSTEQLPGVKNDKSRVSIALKFNATSIDRLSPLIIGRSKTSRALRNVNITATGAIWRNNPKAWMRTDTMNEWLQHFYN